MIAIRLWLVLALLLAGAAQAAPPSDLEAFVNSIYRLDPKSDAWDQWIDRRTRGRWLTRDLAALWTKADAKTKPGDEGPVDFVVITGSQGFDPIAFHQRTESLEGDRAAVAVTLVWDKSMHIGAEQDKTIRYRLVREAGRWKVDDVSGTIDGKPWDLRDILKYSLTE
jgi:hypothetical protein